MDITTCRECNKKVLRVEEAPFPNGGRRFVDEKGALWNGRVCPACNRLRAAESMSERRRRLEQVK